MTVTKNNNNQHDDEFALEMTPDESAKVEAERALAANHNDKLVSVDSASGDKQSQKPDDPEPAQFLPPRVVIAESERLTRDEAVALVNGYRTKADAIAAAKDICHRFGASNPNKADLEDFVAVLRAKASMSKDSVLGRIAEVQPIENPEWLAWDERRRKAVEAAALEAQDDAIARFNSRYFVVRFGSDTLIGVEPDTPSDTYTFQTVSAFHAFNANDRLYSNDGTSVPFSVLWMQHPDRRTYTGVVFEPFEETGQKLNMWRGFAVEPKAPGNGAADWSKLRHHLKVNVCGGDRELYDWVMTWFAHAVQFPRVKMGSALILRGSKGCGKSKVFDWYRKLFGVHALKVSQRSHVTGNFNSHLARLLFLQCEESFWHGDRAAEGVLKDLITGDSIAMEQKKKDVIDVSSYVRLGMTANAESVVPASLADERRYCVIDVAGEWADIEADSPRAAERTDFFAGLDEEMMAGGLQAFMYDLMTWAPPGADWNILRRPPRTEGLVKQGVHSLTPGEQFFLQLIADGKVSGKPGEGTVTVEIESQANGKEFIRSEQLRDVFDAFMLARPGGKYGANNRALFNKLAEEWLCVEPSETRIFRAPPVVGHEDVKVRGYLFDREKVSLAMERRGLGSYLNQTELGELVDLGEPKTALDAAWIAYVKEVAREYVA